MTPNPKVVKTIQQLPKKYDRTIFYIAIAVTFVLILQFVSLYHDWR